MPQSQTEKEFKTYVVDLMQSIGPVSAKSMFGGYGIFLEGVMFGLIADNVLYFKADQDSQGEFKSLGLPPFHYNKKGKEITMSYYQAPEEVLESYDDMEHWAENAYKAALRSASKRKKKTESGS